MPITLPSINLMQLINQLLFWWRSDANLSRLLATYELSRRLSNSFPRAPVKCSIVSRNISESCEEYFPNISSRSRQRAGDANQRIMTQVERMLSAFYLFLAVSCFASGQTVADTSLLKSSFLNRKWDRQSYSLNALKLKEHDATLIRLLQVSWFRRSVKVE